MSAPGIPICLGCAMPMHRPRLITRPPEHGPMDGPWRLDGEKPPQVETCSSCGGCSIAGIYLRPEDPPDYEGPRCKYCKAPIEDDTNGFCKRPDDACWEAFCRQEQKVVSKKKYKLKAVPTDGRKVEGYTVEVLENRIAIWHDESDLYKSGHAHWQEYAKNVALQLKEALGMQVLVVPPDSKLEIVEVVEEEESE